MSNPTGFSEEKIAGLATGLLDNEGLESSNLSITPCDPGGNNRVYVLNVDSKKYLLKNY